MVTWSSVWWVFHAQGHSIEWVHQVYGRMSLSLMNFQMMRVISSPSSSTTGLLLLFCHAIAFYESIYFYLSFLERYEESLRGGVRCFRSAQHDNAVCSSCYTGTLTPSTSFTLKIGHGTQVLNDLILKLNFVLKERQRSLNCKIDGHLLAHDGGLQGSRDQVGGFFPAMYSSIIMHPLRDYRGRIHACWCRQIWALYRGGFKPHARCCS